ncbi:hypothetical protein Y032_0084g1763 [Ancylostoma ceylanicum]|uniref:Reverse transcriptase domain-containing protein n=1 Tax=Ancylostoma ceylanicum TaxID=53326 RepID=A0A016TR31_9BILA|nr:hypothetical protein Y032_0084g1763 [Ancylostoma ceylanicum]
MEMKMLGWMAGVTRYVHICNEDIRRRFGIATMADKFREARLRWYGHFLRADTATVCKVVLNQVPGNRPRRQPKQRWIDTLHSGLKLAGIHPDQAHDRAKWRQRISKADPAITRDKR